MSTEISKILSNIVSFEKLVKTNPEIFNFSKLHIHDVIKLLDNDLDFYIKVIPIKKYSAKDKVYFLSKSTNHKAKEHFKLTDKDIDSLNDKDYYTLLLSEFDTYIRKSRFENLGKSYQSEIFVRNPEWVKTNMVTMPRLTSHRLYEIATYQPSFINKHIPDFSNHSTTALFWSRMIKYDKKYKKIFLENTRSLSTKTDVRNICWSYPEIIKELDLDIINNSKLTCKEWVLLTNNITTHSGFKKIFKDWELSAELKELFRYELTAEVLTGKSKMTKVFQRAMGKVLSKDEEPELVAEQEDNTFSVHDYDEGDDL